MIKVSSWITGACLLAWGCFLGVVSKFPPSDEELGYIAIFSVGIAIGSFALSYLGCYIIRGNKGALRLGVLVSVMWVVGAFVVLEAHNRAWINLFAVSMIPVILYWGVLWVISGFLSKEVNETEKSEFSHNQDNSEKSEFSNNQNKSVSRLKGFLNSSAKSSFKLVVVLALATAVVGGFQAYKANADWSVKHGKSKNGQHIVVAQSPAIAPNGSKILFYSGIKASLAITCSSKNMAVSLGFNKVPDLSPTEIHDGYSLISTVTEGVVPKDQHGALVQPLNSKILTFVDSDAAIKNIRRLETFRVGLRQKGFNVDTWFGFPTKGASAAIKEMSLICPQLKNNVEPRDLFSGG